MITTIISIIISSSSSSSSDNTNDNSGSNHTTTNNTNSNDNDTTQYVKIVYLLTISQKIDLARILTISQNSIYIMLSRKMIFLIMTHILAFLEQV